MIKNRIEKKETYKYTSQTVSRRPLPLDVLLKIKSRKQAITNIKDIAGLILKLEKDYNIKTMKDIKTEKGLSSTKHNELKTEIISLESKIKHLQEDQRNILIYIKYKSINDSYKKSFNKKKFYEKYESELILFESAEKGIKNIDTEKIEQIRDTNEEKIKSMQKQYVELNKGLKQEKDKIETIEKLEKQLEKISAKTKEKEKEQEQNKKKKKNIML